MPASTDDLYAAFRKSAYFPSLNGVRALCALVVVKEHTNWHFPEPQMIEWGFLGVDMFFVISGFLIVTLLLRERDSRGAIDLRQFYLRRTRRIFPIYYLCIGILFFLAVATYSHSTRTWDLYKWSFPIFLLYLQDVIPIQMGVLFHTWSLAMEEQFYLVWPAIEKFCKRALVIPVLLLLIFINQLFNFGYFNDLIVQIYGDPQAINRPIFLGTFTSILLGVLAAHAMHDPKVGPALTKILGNRWMPAVLLVCAGLVCELAPQLQGAPRLLVHVLFCALLVALVVNPAGVFSRTLQSRPMFYLGKISYGLYLYHTLVVLAVGRLAQALKISPSPLASFLVVLPLSILVAGLSYRYIESPIMGLRRRHSMTPEDSKTS